MDVLVTMPVRAIEGSPPLLQPSGTLLPRGYACALRRSERGEKDVEVAVRSGKLNSSRILTKPSSPTSLYLEHRTD